MSFALGWTSGIVVLMVAGLLVPGFLGAFLFGTGLFMLVLYRLGLR